MSTQPAPCGTKNARRRHVRNNETCNTCQPPKQLAPCGTKQARRRHVTRGETCTTCTPKPRTLAPCGTISARKRHKARGETCEPCAPTIVIPQPCGTRAAYKRHYKNGEPPCDPCVQANRDATNERNRANGTKTRTTIDDLIEDITFLLNCGEGEHAILKATGYTTHPHSLRDRLQRHGRLDLYNRITNHYELAA